MPSAVVNAINHHRTALLAREQATMAESARRWLGIEQAIQAKVDALAMEMADGGPVTLGQLARSRRYRDLMAQTRDELRQYTGYMDNQITAGQRSMVVDAISHSQATVNAIATEGQIVVPLNRISTEAVDNMIGLAGDGSPVRAVLNDAARVGPDAMAQELVAGIALGRNPLEVARRAMRMGLGQSFTRMQNIARTEMLRTYRTTTLESYAAGGVVIGYRRLSARDERTCPACLFADGRVYKVEEGFDAHVNCRCVTIPILSGVSPVQYETGQQWFKTQSDATQRSMLGPGRYDAWKAGEASLDDMVSRDWNDTWGGSLRTTRVRDLRGSATRTARRTRLPSTPTPAAPKPAVPTPTAVADPVERMIRETEQRIYTIRDHEEMMAVDNLGNRIFSKGGGSNYIEFTEKEAQMMRGATVTHNHPLSPEGASFSDADVRMAAEYKMAEMRAVGGKYLYKLSLDPSLAWSDIEPIHNQAYYAVRTHLTKQIDAGLMTPKEASLAHYHEVWTQVGKVLGKQWRYERLEHSY